MIHSFDSKIAQKYGILEAVLIQNIYYWIEKNRANNKNFFDGSYWTYNTTKAFSELFPYATERQIKSALKKLREEGILKTGNYNENTYDRTLWYALTEKGLSIVQNGTMHCTKTYNGEDNNVQSKVPNCPMESTKTSDPLDADVRPIPNNKPYIKPYIYYSCAQQDEKETRIMPFITLPLNTGSEYPVYMSDLEEYKKLYPAVDVSQAMRNMRGWLLNNEDKRKSKNGIKRFINSWLLKEQKEADVQKGEQGHQMPNKNKFNNFDQRRYTKEQYVAMENAFINKINGR